MGGRYSLKPVLLSSCFTHCACRVSGWPYSGGVLSPYLLTFRAGRAGRVGTRNAWIVPVSRRWRTERCCTILNTCSSITDMG